jgi:hypothetical protein
MRNFIVKLAAVAIVALQAGCGNSGPPGDVLKAEIEKNVPGHLQLMLSNSQVVSDIPGDDAKIIAFKGVLSSKETVYTQLSTESVFQDHGFLLTSNIHGPDEKVPDFIEKTGDEKTQETIGGECVARQRFSEWNVARCIFEFQKFFSAQVKAPMIWKSAPRKNFSAEDILLPSAEADGYFSQYAVKHKNVLDSFLPYINNKQTYVGKMKLDNNMGDHAVLDVLLLFNSATPDGEKVNLTIINITNKTVFALLKSTRRTNSGLPEKERSEYPLAMAATEGTGPLGWATSGLYSMPIYFKFSKNGVIAKITGSRGFYTTIAIDAKPDDGGVMRQMQPLLDAPDYQEKVKLYFSR